MNKVKIALICMMVQYAIITTCYADVLDPFDNAPAPEGTFAIGTYVFYQDIPEYEDETAGDIDIGVKVPGFIVRPLWFGKQLGDRFSWGLNAVIPFLNVDAEGLSSQSGIGDIAVGPFLFLLEGGSLNISIWEFAYMPTGKYDEDNPDTSPGLDTWQFQHQLAVGYYPSRMGIDWTLNYWQRLESYELEVDLQDAIETDFIIHYTFDHKLTVGGIASLWWDMDNMKVDGQEISGSKGHRYAAGINIMYPFAENLLLSARWTKDFNVKNHTKGDWVYLRTVFLF